MHKAFFGVGFGVRGVPIDILGVYLLGTVCSDLTLLIVDQFSRLNGYDQETIEINRQRLLSVLHNFDQIYGLNPKRLLCSEFMRTQAYRETYAELESRIKADPLIAQQVLEAVPSNRSSTTYTIHEVACVSHLKSRGFTLKLGPSAEIKYDQIIQALGIEVQCEYILDAFALGTGKKDEVVIHYVPGSRGSGCRIFFSDIQYGNARKKLDQGGSETAKRYFCKLASVSGRLLGKSFLFENEIERLHGKRLTKTTLELMQQNVFSPYLEVA